MRVQKAENRAAPKQESKATSGRLYEVHVLDSSSSMMTFNKYAAALEGIQTDIAAAKQTAIQYPEIKSTMSVVEFSNHNKIDIRMWAVPIENIGIFTSKNLGGLTALNDAIAFTILRLKATVNEGDKVLLKIFTDGGENDSRKFRSYEIATMIKDAEREGWTVTFIGTEKDTKDAIAKYQIDESNTYVHQNTGESVKESMTAMVQSRGSYMKSLSEGKDVSKGFFKKINN